MATGFADGAVVRWGRDALPCDPSHLEPDLACTYAGVHQHVSPRCRIDEVKYKELLLLRDKEFLRKHERAMELPPIRLRHIIGDTMHFAVGSSGYYKNGIIYSCYVVFEQWYEVGPIKDLNWAEKARILLWAGDLRLHCTCPAFLYWGFQYLLTVLDASLYPEHRRPRIRNPQERGIVCKHLYRVLDSLPFYLGDIARALRIQFADEAPTRERPFRPERPTEAPPVQFPRPRRMPHAVVS